MFLALVTVIFLLASDCVMQLLTCVSRTAVKDISLRLNIDFKNTTKFVCKHKNSFSVL